MKQHPILFSTPMVQAILEGRKTKTRRIIKKKYSNTDIEWKEKHSGKTKVLVEMQNDVPPPVKNPDGSTTHKLRAYREINPKWKVGDVLWVKESFRVNNWCPEDGEMTFRYEADGEISEDLTFDYDVDNEGEIFQKYWEQSCDDLTKAGYELDENECYRDFDYKALRLRPSIFMRKCISRIWLEITDIRVERLQQISFKDIEREGVSGVRVPIARSMTQANIDHDILFPAAFEKWKTLWQSINGKESWDNNPWVWVISFTRIDNPNK